MIGLSELNLFAIAIAALAGIILGAVWYAPPIFGNLWLQALGKKREDLQSPVRAVTVTLATTFISAAFLAIFIANAGADSALTGGEVGLFIGAGIVLTSMLSDYLFCNFPMRLFLIQAGYRLAQFTLMGAIIGMLQPIAS